MIWTQFAKLNSANFDIIWLIYKNKFNEYNFLIHNTDVAKQIYYMNVGFESKETPIVKLLLCQSVQCFAFT